MSKDSDLAPSRKLVYVHSILPEQVEGSGSIIIMRDGSFRMILRTGAINFDMKSYHERGGLTAAFGNLVNSLEVGFPLQIVSHSKVLNAETYIKQFDSRLDNRNTSDHIRRLINSHIAHFREQVRDNNLLQRELYVVIPWKGITTPEKKNALDDIPFLGFLKGVSEDVEDRRAIENKPTDIEITRANQQLEMRSSHVMSRLSGMSIWSKRLNEDEIRKLLYSYYHPGLSERQTDPGIDSRDHIMGGFSTQGLPASRGGA
jgi:hypothetical protein